MCPPHVTYCQVSKPWRKHLQKPQAQGSAVDPVCHNQAPQWHPCPAHVCQALKLLQLPLSSPGASPGTGVCDDACLGELLQTPEQKCSCPVKMLGNAHSPTTALLLSSRGRLLCLLSTKSVLYQNWLLLKHWKSSQHSPWAIESGYGELWKSFHLQKSEAICGCKVAEDYAFAVCSLWG